jgi:23S rRNA (guanine745-N1)-methyltransferase
VRPVLRCTVRGCAGGLVWEDAQLRCPSGHGFDRGREGYWNLLQPQDRRSPKAGDSDDAVAARRRWLARGFADGLARVLSARIDAAGLPADGVVIDVGCGEGTLTARLFASRADSGFGIDLSTKAIRLAARLEPALTWIVANADRALPFADGSVHLALSIFGRRPVSELSRIIAPTGTLLIVIPAEDDLLELREASQGEGVRRDRVGDVLSELAPAFELAGRETWRHRAPHDREALDDALAMTYRGARASERSRFAAVAALEVTLAAEILALVPCSGVR